MTAPAALVQFDDSVLPLRTWLFQTRLQRRIPQDTARARWTSTTNYVAHAPIWTSNWTCLPIVTSVGARAVLTEQVVS